MKNLIKNSGVRLIAALSIGLLVAQPILAKERHGGIVQISTKDGTTVTGELIAIRDNLLLLETNARQFSNTHIAEINNLLIKRKSHVVGGILLGIMGGSLVGASIGHSGKPSTPRNTGLFSWSNFGRPLATLFGAGIGALVGGFIGGGIGSAQSADLTLIKGGHLLLTEAELLKKLKAQAKVPDAI